MMVNMLSALCLVLYSLWGVFVFCMCSLSMRYRHNRDPLSNTLLQIHHSIQLGHDHVCRYDLHILQP